jgi:hypothetical protein
MPTRKHTPKQPHKLEDDAIQKMQEVADVLHGQNQTLAAVDVETSRESSVIEDQTAELSNLTEAVATLADQLGVEPTITSQATSEVELVEPSTFTPVSNWKELTDQYAPSSIETLTLDSLLSPAQISQIDLKYSAPLKRAPWKMPHDYAAVLGAALIGIIADVFCAPINNPLSKYLENLGMSNHADHGSHTVYKSFDALQRRIQESGIGDKFPWLQKIATLEATHNNLPIDYKGPHFGGAYHRGLSGGHDLLRFLAAIWQIKNGQFLGIRYEYGKPVLEIAGAQPRVGSTPYATHDWATAIILYGLHMAADFFTATSLPVPGATLLREIPNREIRTMVQGAYRGGYNMRHLVGQSVTPFVTGLIIHLYDLLMYRIPNLYKKYVKKKTIEEEAVKGLKLNEMMSTAHTMVAGINIGKVVITGDWLSLNLPQLLTAVTQVYLLGMKTWHRYDIFARVERNQILLDEGWLNLENYCRECPDPSSIEWPNKPILLD